MSCNALSRRSAIGLLAAGAMAAPAFAKTTPAKRVPQNPDVRIIVDNDFAGDPDGLFALAHQLLAPKARTVLVTSSFLNPKFRVPGLDPDTTAAQGAAVARELLHRLKPLQLPPVFAGSEGATIFTPSPAAKAIVAEAMRDDPLPLVFTCGGPLTNLAGALRLAPEIARRMSLIWIGGEPYPKGGWEYNLDADADAARQVIEATQMPVTQVTRVGYRKMALSIAEFETDFRPISPFTEWLYQRFTDIPDFVKIPGAWPMGDTPTVLLSSISAESSPAQDVTARRIRPDLSYGDEIPGRTVRVIEEPDARLAFADFRARLESHARTDRR